MEKEGGEWLREVADVFGVKGWRKTRNGNYMVPYCTSLCVPSVSQSVSWFVSSANSTTLHESTAQYQSNFLFPFVFCLFTCTYFCLVNLLRITNVCRTVNQSLLEHSKSMACSQSSGSGSESTGSIHDMPCRLMPLSHAVGKHAKCLAPSPLVPIIKPASREWRPVRSLLSPNVIALLRRTNRVGVHKSFPLLRGGGGDRERSRRS